MIASADFPGIGGKFFFTEGCNFFHEAVDAFLTVAEAADAELANAHMRTTCAVFVKVIMNFFVIWIFRIWAAAYNLFMQQMFSLFHDCPCL